MQGLQGRHCHPQALIVNTAQRPYQPRLTNRGCDMYFSTFFNFEGLIYELLLQD